MDEIQERGVEIPELQTDFLFRRRPLALAADLRPSWRIALLVLILRTCCRGRKSSRTRLHVISWGVRNNQSQQELKAAVAGEVHPSILIVRFDPFLDRALDFAIGDALIAHDGGKNVRLTATGSEFANEVIAAEEILKLEKTFLNDLGNNVTEALINKMFGWKD